MSKRKFIIDCDAGVDDAVALILALNQEDIDILAITCVGGNTGLDQVCTNVMKVLEVCERTDVPVFKGAGTPLVGNDNASQSLSTCFHGKDGLGDVSDIPDPDMSRLKQEHAVDAIIRLTNENPAEITLVALAPLTNIALVCRMDPFFPKKLKNAVIMGGNCEAKGNDLRVCSEFNFHFDVESASICLNELTCPVTVVTWEACLKNCFSWSFYDKLANIGSERSNFFKKITKNTATFYKRKKSGYGFEYTCCDLLAMGIAVQPNMVVKEAHVHATVELSGIYTRGQMVVDWRSSLKKQPNIKLVQNVDLDQHRIITFDSLK